jgi:uncharacterized protein
MTPHNPSKAIRPEPEAAGGIDAGRAKEHRLLDALGRIDSLLVAYSGGADSAYLAWAAHQAMGQRMVAITALSASFSAHDRQWAEEVARAGKWRHECIETHELENPLYAANAADRCFHCKDELFIHLEALAGERGVAAIAYGINADDTRDFRPGHRAAAEHQILAPLLDAGLTKAEIRALSRVAGLATWDRPAAACLSSRVPYGIQVTPELLAKIERGETALRAMGFRQFRVRAHGELARIEIAAEELPRVFAESLAPRISADLREAGFSFVTLDLEGYRQGSLNILLQPGSPSGDR